VEFQGLSEDAPVKGKGHTLDLNINGCRIESHSLVPRGSYLRLQLTLPNSAKLVTIGMARVRWVQAKSFGVEFIQRAAEDLPLITQVTAETGHHQDSVAQAIRKRIGKGPCSVLIVEDDPDILHLCAKTLEDVGFKVLKASGSVEGLQITSAHPAPIHLMLVDLILRPSVFQLQDGKDRHPRVHGHDFVHYALKQRKECRVVYMSGHEETALKALGIEIGGALCLQKPFSREDLLVAIEQVLASPPLTPANFSGKSSNLAANDR
jgi:CheY-like chemotaxis protein